MAGKIQIPDELKKDLPQTKWGKILAATPIIMTVVATMLAGLASSEMTKAQYDRASAAQQPGVLHLQGARRPTASFCLSFRLLAVKGQQLVQPLLQLLQPTQARLSK